MTTDLTITDEDQLVDGETYRLSDTGHHTIPVVCRYFRGQPALWSGNKQNLLAQFGALSVLIRAGAISQRIDPPKPEPTVAEQLAAAQSTLREVRSVAASQAGGSFAAIVNIIDRTHPELAPIAPTVPNTQLADTPIGQVLFNNGNRMRTNENGPRPFFGPPPITGHEDGCRCGANHADPSRIVRAPGWIGETQVANVTATDSTGRSHPVEATVDGDKIRIHWTDCTCTPADHDAEAYEADPQCPYHGQNA